LTFIKKCGIIQNSMTVPGENQGLQLHHSPRGEIADAQTELGLVGLSTDFPEIVQELNSNLAAGWNTRDIKTFQGYRFNLSPGKADERPRVDVEEKHFFPFNVSVDESPQKRAEFTVESARKGTPEYQRSPQMEFVTNVGFEALQAFVLAYPDEHGIRVTTELADRSEVDEAWADVGDISSFGEAILQGRPSARFKLGFQHAERSIKTSLLMPMHYGEAFRGQEFGVGQIKAIDSSENIERIIKAYSSLVKPPWE
jgi:hypothetical protein